MDQIFQTLLNGATYGGSFQHSIINYTALMVAILPQFIGISEIESKIKNGWIWTFFSAAFIQIVLWFLANAMGISLIWSILTGFNFILFIKKKSLLGSLNKIVYSINFVLVFFATAYYFVAFPLITTIAHLVAFALGIGFYFLFIGKKSILKE